MRYDHRVTIRRTTKTVGREITDSVADAATGVACRIEAEHGRMTVGETGNIRDYNAIALFPIGTDIRPDMKDTQGDEIIQTKPATGATFRVLSVGDEAGTGHHLVAKLIRVGQTVL